MLDQCFANTNDYPFDLSLRRYGFPDVYPHLQVIVDKDAQVVGAETLLRYVNPTTNELERNPLPYIAALNGEERGLLDTSMMLWVANLIADIKSRHDLPKDFFVSVNLGPDFFESAPIFSNILLIPETIMQHIKLEVLETNKIDSDSLLELCAAISHRAPGMSFALDDICSDTLDAGLNLLHAMKHTFPREVNVTVKLDRSLIVDSSQSSSIQDGIRQIVAECQSLRGRNPHPTVAEGIEDKQTAITLGQMGITNFQGFHFGRPESPKTTLPNTFFAPKTARRQERKLHHA